MLARSALDAGETIRHGWEIVKANLALVVVLTIIAGLAPAAPSQIADALERPVSPLALLFRLAGFVLSVVVTIGVTRISLRLHDGQRVELSDLFRADWSLFWRYLVATIAYALVVALGLALFIVPGVVLAIRYLFYAYFVLEQGARPGAALGLSAAATQGARWNLFLLGMALLFVNFVGALLLGIGLLVTLPVSYLALARAYRVLTATGPQAAGATRAEEASR